MLRLFLSAVRLIEMFVQFSLISNLFYSISVTIPRGKYGKETIRRNKMIVFAESSVEIEKILYTREEILGNIISVVRKFFKRMHLPIYLIFFY